MHQTEKIPKLRKNQKPINILLSKYLLILIIGFYVVRCCCYPLYIVFMFISGGVLVKRRWCVPYIERGNFIYWLIKLIDLQYNSMNNKMCLIMVNCFKFIQKIKKSLTVPWMDYLLHNWTIVKCIKRPLTFCLIIHALL